MNKLRKVDYPADSEEKTSKKLLLPDYSSDSESSDNESGFKINKSYAANYNVWRNKEELQKLKDLSKDVSSSSSSSTETEGEYDSEDEINFYRTLSLLKAKDPRIYDKNTEFYKDKTVEKKPKVKKSKPLYMKDYERQIVLERNGKFSSDEEEHIPTKGPTYSEEQEDLKRSFKEALNDSDDEDDNLLNVRKKTKKEKEQEEADYIRWLKGEEVDLPEDTKKDLLCLRNYFNDPNLDENEKFLRDFFLNRKWDEKASDDEIPSYDVVTLSEDERITEEQDNYERAYNFRFEEPDGELIKRYPRVIEDSLRKTDTRRKVKREEYSERKRKEKEQKREELKRLKALKRKEIEEKFTLLKEVSGQDDIKLDEDDIESDFDPDKHEQRMREMFNDDFYSVEEVQKPEFPYDEELDTENWDSWAGEAAIGDDNDEISPESKDNCLANTENKKSAVNNSYNDNNDAKVQFEKEMVDATQTKKKRVRKKSLFAKTISKPKPVYDPSGKSFDEYLDEYYKLDYEDIIGDMPVRFKYRKVVPNSFGLTVDEILAANDKELNRWCSIKKTSQYRDEQEEFYDVQAFQKKAENALLKKKVLPSVYVDDEEVQSQGIKRKRKKKSKCGSDEFNKNNVTNCEPTENIDSKLRAESSGKNAEELVSVNDTGAIHSGGRKSKKRSKHELNEIHNHDLSSDIHETIEDADSKLISEKDTREGQSSVGKSMGEGQNESKKKRRRRKKLKISSGEIVANPDASAFDIDVDKDFEVLPNNSVKHMKEVNCQNLNTKTNKTFNDESKKISFHMQQSPNNKNHVDNFEHPISTNDSNLREEKVQEQGNHSNVDITQINQTSTPNLTKNKKKKKKKKKSKTNVDADVNTNLPLQTFQSASQANSKQSWKKNKYGQLNNIGDLNASNKFNVNKSLSVSKKRFSEEKPNKGQEKNFNKYNSDKRLFLTDERLAAYGFNPKKFKNKIKYSQK